jgi:hypothetical protein
VAREQSMDRTLTFFQTYYQFLKDKCSPNLILNSEWESFSGWYKWLPYTFCNYQYEEKKKSVLLESDLQQERICLSMNSEENPSLPANFYNFQLNTQVKKWRKGEEQYCCSVFHFFRCFFSFSLASPRLVYRSVLLFNLVCLLFL